MTSRAPTRGSGPAAVPAEARHDGTQKAQIQADLALVKRMLRGDEQAMSEFCDTYLPRLYRFALRRVAVPEDADDVVQVVLSNAARRIETYGGQATLHAWLLGICRREISKVLGAADRAGDVVSLYGDGPAELVAGMSGPAADEPDRVTDRFQLTVRVHEWLDRLPERHAAVLEMKYVDGYSSREIAQRLAISDEAAQSLLARARRAFREVCDERILQEMEIRNGE